MPNRYCDPSLGGTTTAAGTAPSGGYADDGDGNATTRATAGTVTITVSDYTQWVAGSDSLSVIGATAVTIAAPSSNNDMASKLATAINASTATNANSTVNPRTAQLRNLVNAVASGATVTIYTRTGGTAWNSLTCTTTKAAAFSNSFPVTFSGATAGAWAYLHNPSTIWPQSITPSLYGLWGATLPFTGALDPGDVVYVRANNTTVTFATGINFTAAAQGSADAPVTYVIDNGVIWADGADKTLTFVMPSATGSMMINHIAGWYVHILSSTHSSTGNRLLRFQMTGASASSLYVYAGGNATYENVEFSVASTNQSLWVRDNVSGLTTFVNCVFMSGKGDNLFGASYGSNTKMVFIGCEFSGKTSAGTQVGTPTAGLISAGVSYAFFNFVGCKFTNWVTGSRLLTTGSAAYAVVVNASNCDFGGITVRSPAFYTGVAVVNPWTKCLSISSQFGQRDWTLDCQYGIAEWDSSRSFPTRSALQVDGITPWSLRFCASTVSGNTYRSAPFYVPRIGKINSLADGTRTVTVHFCLEKSMTWTKKDISVVVQYTDTTGVLRSVDTFDINGGSLTSDENGEWSQYGSGADAANVVWNNSGNIYHKQYKLAVSCPNMKTDTDVGVFLRLHSTVGSVNYGGFLDPDFDIV